MWHTKHTLLEVCVCVYNFHSISHTLTHIYVNHIWNTFHALPWMCACVLNPQSLHAQKVTKSPKQPYVLNGQTTFTALHTQKVLDTHKSALDTANCLRENDTNPKHSLWLLMALTDGGALPFEAIFTSHYTCLMRRLYIIRHPLHCVILLKGSAIHVDDQTIIGSWLGYVYWYFD